MQQPGPGPNNDPNNDPDAETRRISDQDAEAWRAGDGGAGSYRTDPGVPPGQPGYPPPDTYPPTAGYPQGGGYSQSGDYPPGSYPQGGYPQGGYDQGAYGQGGYGGYPQGGYSGYPQGGYGGYPPPAPGGPGGGPPSHRQRNIIIISAAAVLLLVGIPLVIVLATRGGDDKPDPNGGLTISASATGPPTTAPTTTTPSRTPSPTPTPADSFTASQRSLLSQLDRSVMVDCEPYKDGEGGAVDASVFCTTNDNRDVVAYHFVDSNALAADTRNRESTIADDGDCKDGVSSVQQWDYNDGIAQGALLCYFSDENDYIIYWTYENKLVSFITLDSDAAGLYRWWSNFEPVLR